MIDLQPICTVAVALGATSLLLSLAAIAGRSIQAPEDGTEPPATVDQPMHRPSMKMSRKQLLQLARDHKVGTAKWRARARKSDFVQALQAIEDK